MNNILIIGIDKTNHNHNKITGFINSFSKKYCVTHIIDKNFIEINKIIKEKNIDTIFGESDQFYNINYEGVKNCFIWINLDLFKTIKLAELNKKTNFFLCVKSIIHDYDIVKKYIKINSSKEYQISGVEGQLDIEKSCKKINESKKINNDCYRITENLKFIYLPCCLSEKNDDFAINKKFDICYFGTTNNRPKVISSLNELRQKGYQIKSNLFDGYINPEKCLSFYKESYVTLSQQIKPTELEFPVRLGESSSNNCCTLLFDDYDLNKLSSSLIPTYKTINDTEDIINEINFIKNNKLKFNYKTYDDIIFFLENINE